MPLRAAATLPDAVPAHLVLALDLVEHIRPEDTHYQHKDFEVSFERPCTCKTDCSGLLDALLKQAYGSTSKDFQKQFGARHPQASHYHDAIEKGAGFKRITRLSAVEPGDILAVKYAENDPDRKDNDTGHVMLVVVKPARRQATEPVKSGTRQWEVEVIDQTRSPHGPEDNRARWKQEDKSGLGRGLLRLYTDADGAVAGYTWSTEPGSKYRSQEDRHLVIGRLERP
jgi:hypothetical protein